MNKDLPRIIRKVFTDPDPTIWQGIWLTTLETLVQDIRMNEVWANLANALEIRHAEGSSLKFNQYMKWELKGFVAQVVKFQDNKDIIDNSDYSADFSRYLAKYFLKKGIIVDNHIFQIVFKVIFESVKEKGDF